jgi:hypothetical protein
MLRRPLVVRVPAGAPRCAGSARSTATLLRAGFDLRSLETRATPDVVTAANGTATMANQRPLPGDLPTQRRPKEGSCLLKVRS